MAYNEKASALLRITGRVQGVWYRASAASEAKRLGLTGWIRNVPDGSVVALAQGRREDVSAFIEWCRSGPPSAEVKNVHTDWLDKAEDLPTFSVRT
jgi:acylphosphatase